LTGKRKLGAQEGLCSMILLSYTASHFIRQ